ncbi:MAG: DNA primase [bacterium]|nr:DNA primase [bacterium]
MLIPPHIIDQIRSAAGIVDVVGEHVPLRKMGRNYLGLCPFHKEKTPSFNVNAERGMYKCFGCGKAGNAITFVQDFMHLGFVDAIRYLADKYGVIIPQEEREDPTGILARKDAAYAALREATSFYQTILASSDGATIRTYFEQRGFSAQTVDEFTMGASPAGWDGVMVHLTKNGYSGQQLSDAGLIITKEVGRSYDRFRGRAMFPVRDDVGRVVGFSARTMVNEEGTPKYINSPQGLVYDKSRVLYGLDKAKRVIAEHRLAVIVEGQADVVMMHQAGFRNTVASSGTALTDEHLRLLRKHADTVMLVFDADNAGQAATTRAIELALAGGFDVRCVVLPAGTDPDSLIRTEGASVMQDVLNAAVSWLLFQTNRLRLLGMLDDPVQQAKAVRTMLDWISTVPDGLRHTFLIRDLAKEFRLDERMLMREFRPVRAAQPLANTETALALPDKPLQHVASLLPPERELLRIALCVDDGLALLINKYNIDEDMFWSERGHKLFRHILIADAEHHDILHYVLNDEGLTADERREVGDIAFSVEVISVQWERFNVELPDVDNSRPIRDALVSLRIHRLTKGIEDYTHQLERIADVDERMRILHRLNKLVNEREESRRRLNDDSENMQWLQAGTQSE